jgi:camphor 5-monooxygenase
MAENRRAECVPPHVPREAIVEFDVYNPPPSGGIHDAWMTLRRPEGPRLLWTPCNGGHWIATRGKDIKEIFSNYEAFSSRLLAVPKESNEHHGLLPLFLDPPAQKPYRALIVKALTPRRVQAMEDSIRRKAVSLIEQFRHTGRCEFIDEFARKLPIGVFLDLIQVSDKDGARLTYLAEQFNRPTELTPPQVMAAFADYLRPLLAERRGQGSDELLTTIASGAVDGRPLTELEAIQVATLVMLAGLDTVASFLGFMMLFLAENPGHRRQLVDDPGAIPNAVGELLRRFPIVTVTRTVTRDMVYNGQTVKAGDLIVTPSILHGLDDDEFKDARRVDFARPLRPGSDSTFGGGPHHCPGQGLGRLELKVVLEEWLSRIPDFAVANRSEIGMRSGVVASMERLPLCWNSP